LLAWVVSLNKVVVTYLVLLSIHADTVEGDSLDDLGPHHLDAAVARQLKVKEASVSFWQKHILCHIRFVLGLLDHEPDVLGRK